LGERTLLPSSASASAETLPGSAVGTPAYMSPEQARGDLDALGPWSDVYSLGATLFCLLTGRPPYEGDDIGTILRHVQNGEFPPPRQLDPTIDRALEAICLKAMVLMPEDRYESCRALVEDIDRWLADEPVSARGEPLRERAWRWVRKHPIPASAVAAALVVGLAASLYGLRRERAFATGLAAANTAIDQQRTRAEDRERQAIDAVKRFRDAVAENPALKNNPALEDLRKTLLKEPLAFFRTLRDQLQADNDTRPEALARLAQAALELGDLISEIGDWQDALTACQEALTIRERLAREDPATIELQNRLALNLNLIGYLQRRTGQPQAARASFERALGIMEQLARVYPAITQYQSGLVTLYSNIGLLQGDMGQPQAALGSHERALAIQERLARENPADIQFQDRLARSYNSIGILQSETGQPGAAMISHERALRIVERLAREHPTITQFQTDLARTHSNIANLQGEKSQREAELKSNERVLLIVERLAREHPAVTEFQNHLALIHHNMGSTQRNMGHSEAALRSYTSAFAIWESLAREHPQVPEFASRLGSTLNNMSRIDLDVKRFAAASDHLHQAIFWHKRALSANPKHPEYRQVLMINLGLLAETAHALGRNDEWVEAERELAELKASDPRFSDLDVRLAAVVSGAAPKDNAERLALAQRAYDTGRHAAAVRLWGEALKSDPNLARDRQDQHAYNAACAAALAASGQGKDKTALDDAAKARLRQQAHAWLSSELVTWSGLLQTGPPEGRSTIVQILGHWQQDTDLASVRNRGPLSKLSEQERQQWQTLWARVEELLRRAEADSTGRPAPHKGELPTNPFAR
jgi:tetratricopeptide (TPR) repeat protein